MLPRRYYLSWEKKEGSVSKCKKVGSGAGVLFWGGNVCHLQRAGGLDNRLFRYIENTLLVKGLLFWMSLL
jgi:hypothetical protein